MAAAVYHARNVVAGDERASGPTQREAQTADDGVKAQWMENWFDGLSYCKSSTLRNMTEQSCLQCFGGIPLTKVIRHMEWHRPRYHR
jgi:hypothetical protein